MEKFRTLIDVWGCYLTEEIVQKLRELSSEEFRSRSISLAERIAKLLPQALEESKTAAINNERLSDWEETRKDIDLAKLPPSPIFRYNCPFFFSSEFNDAFPVTIWFKASPNSNDTVRIFTLTLSAVVRLLSDEEYELLQLIMYRQMLNSMIYKHRKIGEVLTRVKVQPGEKFGLF
jgi:hypothetical protein